MTHSLQILVFFVLTSTFTLKTESTAPPEQLPKEQRELLEAKSFQVSDASGQKILSFWLRKEIPLEATTDQIANGVSYREVVPGSIVGCLEVHQQWTDFRKQEVKPGVYILRLAIQPPTGDHEGTAPHTEFCILCPADQDKEIEPLDLKQLIKLSSKVTGTAHPSVMLLYPVRKPAEVKEAKIDSPSESIQTLIVVRDAKAEKGKGLLGFAFTVAGVRKE